MTILLSSDAHKTGSIRDPLICECQSCILSSPIRYLSFKRTKSLLEYPDGFTRLITQQSIDVLLRKNPKQKQSSLCQLDQFRHGIREG